MTSSYRSAFRGAVLAALVFCACAIIPSQARAVEARLVSSPFLYTFADAGKLQEAYPASDSTSPYFWLDSGGYTVMQNGTGGTNQGALPATDPWRLLYAASNPLDTGNGYYPQNLFRMITRASWGNASEELHFFINKVNLTNTPNRDGYSGVLLMSRYKDSANLYYAGVRMDGTAVIKKKVNGTYYTLAQGQVWNGTYNKTSNPNLIPTQKWMGLKSVTQDQTDGSVKIALFLDENNSGAWKQILVATDKNGVGGLSAVRGAYPSGIRTDYMDILFDNYRITAL